MCSCGSDTLTALRAGSVRPLSLSDFVFFLWWRSLSIGPADCFNTEIKQSGRSDTSEAQRILCLGVADSARLPPAVFSAIECPEQSKVRRHRMEITVDLVDLILMFLNRRTLPVNARSMRAIAQLIVADIGLINLEMASPIEMAENAPSEAYFLKKSAIDSGNVLVLRIYQDHSLHADQYLLDMRWRVVAGIGTELEPQQRSPGFPTPGLPVSVPSYSYRKASGIAFRMRLTRSALSFSCFRLRSNSAGGSGSVRFGRTPLDAAPGPGIGHYWPPPCPPWRRGSAP